MNLFARTQACSGGEARIRALATPSPQLLLLLLLRLLDAHQAEETALFFALLLLLLLLFCLDVLVWD